MRVRGALPWRHVLWSANSVLSKGTLFFDDLPKGTYFQEGSQDIADKGKAMYFMFDTCGSCLIPIIDTNTGEQVVDISKAGRSIH